MLSTISIILTVALEAGCISQKDSALELLELLSRRFDKASIVRIEASPSAFVNVAAFAIPRDVSGDTRSKLESVMVRFLGTVAMCPRVVVTFDKQGKFRIEQTGDVTLIWDGSRGIEFGKDRALDRSVKEMKAFSTTGGGWLLYSEICSLISMSGGSKMPSSGKYRAIGDILVRDSLGLDESSSSSIFLNPVTHLPYRIEVGVHRRGPLSNYFNQAMSGPLVVLTWSAIEFTWDPPIASDFFCIDGLPPEK